MVFTDRTKFDFLNNAKDYSITKHARYFIIHIPHGDMVYANVSIICTLA